MAVGDLGTRLTLNLTSIKVMGKSRSPKNFRRLWFVSLKETKSSLVSIIYLENNQRVPRQRVQMSDFYFLCGVITVGKLMLRHFTLKYLESRASQPFMKRCVRLNL